jgi:hypothetical protein
LLGGACAGAAAGRALLPWAEARLGRLRSLHSRAARLGLANSRPLCEAAGAATGLAVGLRGRPALARAHMRSLRAATIGAVAGHGVARLACREDECDAALRP